MSEYSHHEKYADSCGDLVWRQWKIDRGEDPDEEEEEEEGDDEASSSDEASDEK
jgi:hypothetical protein